MTNSLFDRLQLALAGTYRLERELPGGGMSRVFVAEEIALGRTVVLKVLPPERAVHVRLERFRREIQLAASLQHPHIMPVFSAGEILPGPDGPALLYYSMPFVTGESLSDRIAASGPLESQETVRLLLDVADALAHAHARGVVHRDIKPGNVMVSGRHALLTDLGVAKALGVSAGEARVTGSGIAIGTPAYMAPEQVTADPGADHRADLYSFGAMAYEMLSGAPPFTGITVQKVITAHLTEDPVPIGERRPDVPPRLAALVARCLAKDPADRPQTADAIRVELEQIDVGSDSSATVASGAVRPAVRRRRGWWWLGGLGAVAAAAFLLLRSDSFAGRSLLDEGRLARRQRVLVASFENRTSDSTLGPTVTEAFRVDFTQTNLLTVVSPEAIRTGLRRMQRPDTTSLTLPVATELAIRGGIEAVVIGDIAQVGPRYTLAVHLVEASTGEELAAFRETAAGLGDLIETIDRLSARLRRRTGESLREIRSDPPLARVTTASLEALRKFSVAMRAQNAGRPDDALALLDEAVRLDSTFASAWRAIGVILANSGRDPGRMMAARARAYDLRDRLPARERYLTEASYYRSLGDAGRTAAAYRSLLELDPDDVAALNNLGLVHADAGETGPAAGYFRRALAIDSLQGIVYGNLIDVLLTRRDIATADSVYAVEIRRTGPTSRTRLERIMRHWVAGQPDSAAAVAESLSADPGTNPSYRALATEYLALMAGARGRLREAARIYAPAARFGPMGASRLLNAHGTAAAQQALMLGRPAAARADLDRFRSDSAWTSLDPADRPYLDVAMGYAIAGDPDRAEALLREQAARGRLRGPDGRVLPANREDSSAMLAIRGLVLVARGNPAAGAAVLDAADVYSGRTWFADLAALAYDQAGLPDSAVARYERFLASGFPYRFYVDAARLGPALERLGQLYEERGERGRAAATDQQLIELWRNADPELMPRVRDVRRSLAALDAPR